MSAPTCHAQTGPYGDDLVIGETIAPAPAITIDHGVAAYFQALCGDPSPLSLSAALSEAVTGSPVRLANAGLVLQIAIGQSTVATKIVIANLFYRDVTVHRQVHLGDTLTTQVTPTARAYTRDTGKGRRAKVLLSIETRDQHGRLVASLERLALLPLRSQDDLVEVGEIGAATPSRSLDDFVASVPADWDLSQIDRGPLPAAGFAAADPLRDSVSDALGLVRLTQNLAAAHRDPARGQQGRRLVYGGHVIALAQASLSRLVPSAVTILGWRSCDHLSPTFEDDLLGFAVELEDTVAVPGGVVAGLRVRGRAYRADHDVVEVIDFRPVALLAGISGGLYV
ncbi:hotdog family protein [Rhodococcus koreensis]|uniref:acyl dehydratase n=1 Tax=Rhodococcus koreensis TaxID=99653 RepID=UPI0036D78CD2